MNTTEDTTPTTTEAPEAPITPEVPVAEAPKAPARKRAPRKPKAEAPAIVAPPRPLVPEGRLPRVTIRGNKRVGMTPRGYIVHVMMAQMNALGGGYRTPLAGHLAATLAGIVTVGLGYVDGTDIVATDGIGVAACNVAATHHAEAEANDILAAAILAAATATPKAARAPRKARAPKA